MAFYDHFHSSETSSITPIGRKLVDLQNRWFIRLIRTYCQAREPVILEVGCGFGFFAELCRTQGLPYVALEANSTMAAALAARGFDVRQAFVPPVAVDRDVDVIFMDQVFEHMKNRDEAIEMVDSCRRQLRKGGILVISSPDIFTFKEDFYSDYTHSYPTSMPVLTQILSDGGFDVIHQDYLVFFVRGQLLTRMLAQAVRFLYGVGVFHLVFRKKARMAKTALLPSCVVVGRV
jgi:SAM-dependent methyltransferase